MKKRKMYVNFYPRSCDSLIEIIRAFLKIKIDGREGEKYGIRRKILKRNDMSDLGWLETIL